MDAETQSAPGARSPGIVAMQEAKELEAKAKKLKAEAKALKAEAKAKAERESAENEKANERLRAPLVKLLKGFDTHIATYEGEVKTNEKAQARLVSQKLAIDLKLNKYRWTAGKILSQLKATFSYGGWTKYLNGLCKGGENEQLTMSPRSAHTYLSDYEKWAGHEDVGEKAAEKGLLKKSKTILAVINNNPKVTDSEEIFRVADQQITDAKVAASDALSLLRDQYKVGGQLDKVQKIERAEGGYKVTVRLAADVIAKAAPAETNISVILNAEQLAKVPGGVNATVTMMNSEAVSRFLTACGVAPTVTEKKPVTAVKTATTKGAAEGK